MINLHFVDELIAARRDQHGGGRGAPQLAVPGIRIGTSLNRSCIVMLSALLQGHVDEVFQLAAPIAFPAFSRAGASYDKFLEKARRAGNPSPSNIDSLFRQLGVPALMDGLAWPRHGGAVTTQMISDALDEINQVRNRIAHSQPLTLNGDPYHLTLARVRVLRNLVAGFGEHFQAHALAKVRASRI